MKKIAATIPTVANAGAYFQKNGLQVFMPFYHAISEEVLPHMKHLYTLRNKKQFINDLDYLLKHFTPVKLSEFLSGKYSAGFGKPPMVLSFDDGLIQCYTEIMPILLQKGIPATFFLNNAFIDNKAMFFRYKVSLLIEALSAVTDSQLIKAAELLKCNQKDIRKRLLAVSYVDREITDQVANGFEFSFDTYMRKNPIYMGSIQIRKMQSEGFEFGSHGIDHPLFALLKKQATIDHIKASVTDLAQQYDLDYKYFAFPFTDSGVEDVTIDVLFEKGIIDAGFGTAGLKDDKWPNYYQRVPMELFNKGAKAILNGEINRRRIRTLAGKNMTSR